MNEKPNPSVDDSPNAIPDSRSPENVERAEKDALALIEKSALQQLYEHPLVVGLTSILPGVGPAVYAGASAQVQEMYQKSVRSFFQQLSDGTTPLTPKLVESQDFLHAYFSTFSAAMRSSRSEKIRLFARLLRKYAESEQAAMGENTEAEREGLADDFEENLQILDDLSLREFRILCILRRFEESHPIENGSFQLRNTTFWHSFCGELWKLGVKDINGTMARLTRTGLYQIFSLRDGHGNQSGIRGSIDNPEDLSQCGMLTWLFGHFLCSLGIENEQDFQRVTGQ